jgi:NADH:ubiquinone oxidoreductase subunit E
MAPVMQLNDDYCGLLNEQRLAEMLQTLQEEPNRKPENGSPSS